MDKCYLHRLNNCNCKYAEKEAKVSESPSLTGSSARCDEPGHILVKIGCTEYGMTEAEGHELAKNIESASIDAYNAAAIIYNKKQLKKNSR